MNNNLLEVYTDGACEPNPGKGGWAYVATVNKKVINSKFGNKENTTNNEMELKAIIEAARDNIKSDKRLIIHSDNMYCVDGINSWMYEWEKNNWKRGRNKEVKNLDLFKEAFDLFNNNDIVLCWIKAHAGHEFNEMADKLSYKAIDA